MLKIIAVLIIIVTGLTLTFGDASGRFRRLIQIVFGLSIAFKARSRACMLRSQIHAESANTDGYVNTFIERTYRVLQVIESIVPAVPCLSEEAAMTYTRAYMAREQTGVRCAFQIVLNKWIVFSACALLRFSAGGMLVITINLIQAMRFGMRGIGMLNLAEYRSKPQRLADFLR